MTQDSPLDTTPTYSIPICNLNMSATLERSLRSVLDQTDQKFEIFVVDGGSSDRSQKILETINSEFENLQYTVLNDHPNIRLGGERALSIRNTTGEYLLLRVDMDEYYEDALRDVVKLYHQMESQLERGLFLTVNSVSMVRRDDFCRIGSYRNVAAAEDLDVWRRVLADEDMLYIHIQCDPPICYSIGYDTAGKKKFQRLLEMRISEFQTGMTLTGMLQHNIGRHDTTGRILGDLCLTLLSYALAVQKPRFEPVDEYQNKVETRQELQEKTYQSLSEIESKHDINIDRNEFVFQGLQ